MVAAHSAYRELLAVDADPLICARFNLVASSADDALRGEFRTVVKLICASGHDVPAGLQDSSFDPQDQDTWPIPFGAASLVPMNWLKLRFPPLRLDNPSLMDALLWRVQPYCDRLIDAIPLFLENRGDLHIPRPIAEQLLELVDEAKYQLTNLLSIVHPVSQVGFKELEGESARLRLLDEAREEAETRMVVLGEDEIPGRLVKIGQTKDGRLLALTLSSPQFVAILGSQGFGKSHLATIVAEGASLELDTLNRLGDAGASHVFVFCNEWRNKKGNRQFLRGLFPNPDPEEITFLREHFHYMGNAAYERLVMVCLPGQKAHYEQTMPELIERGLEIHEARLHPSELVQVSYAMLFNNGSENAGADKPKWMQYVEQVMAERPGLRPLEIARILEDKKIGTPTVLKQLHVLETFVSQDERFTSHLRDKSPRIVLLESQTMPRDLILPLQVMMMNALSAEDQDEHLVFIIEEGNKGLENRAVQEALVNGAAEVRHGHKTIVISAQQGAGFPARLWPLVTAGALFYIPSPAEYHRLQEQIGALAGVHYDVVAKLGLGEALMWAVKMSDGKLSGRAVPIKTRPTCIWAGGKTRQFT